MLPGKLTTLHCFDHISSPGAPIDMTKEVMETRQDLLQLSCFVFLLVMSF